MKVILVGIRETSYKNKETGDEVSGQAIYFEYEQDHVSGMATDRAFIPNSKRLVPIPAVPCSASIFYNRYGKIDEVVITS